MAAFVGQPVGWALTGAVTLAVPLALLGAVYGALVGLGRAKPGMFAPAALVWFVGFPARAPGARDRDSRPAGREPDPPDDVVTFLAYQAMVSLGFAIGFTWLYERITPAWMLHLKEHNPYAERVYARYVAHANAVWAAREQKRARRAASTGAAARGRSRPSS
jgi:hypothetical protein